LSRKRILVLGASGFIGRRIVAALEATDWAQPIAAGRAVEKLDFVPAEQRIRLDATDQDALPAAIMGCSAVVSSIAGNSSQILCSGNALLRAVAQAGAPPRFVYLSSMDAYGSATGVIDETSPLRGDLNDYSRAKATIDGAGAGRPGVIILRPGIVYGPQSPWWSDRIARLLIQRRLGDLGELGSGICNLVHVDDVAAAVVRALVVPEADGQAFNLGDPDPPTWNTYFRFYAQALGAGPLRRISRTRLIAELNLFGPALKIAELALRDVNPWRSNEAIRPWLLKLTRRQLRLQTGKAEEMLNVRFRPWRQGVQETATWFVSSGHTKDCRLI
jgi:2-alkyl-3-oxoalkanoate reductase